MRGEKNISKGFVPHAPPGCDPRAKSWPPDPRTLSAIRSCSLPLPAETGYETC